MRPLLPVVLAAVTLGASCARPAPVVEVEEAASVAVPLPIETRLVYEDIERPWMPPAESSLAEGGTPLAEIGAQVEAARVRGQAALASTDQEELVAAHDQVVEAQAAVTGLAVRLRPVWSQHQYTQFLVELRFHEILDLRHNLAHRRATLSTEAWLWGTAAANP